MDRKEEIKVTRQAYSSKKEGLALLAEIEAITHENVNREGEFLERFTGFLEGAQRLINEAYINHPLEVPQLEVERGRKYARVLRDGGAFCFIDLTTGDVLKPKSWRGPAKGARGNIFDESYGLKCISAYGVASAR